MMDTLPVTRIVFLVQAHGDLPQLQRLCARLREHKVFIHMDLKASNFNPSDFAALQHVTVLSNRVSVHWGDYSQVDAIFNLINAALDVKESFSKFVLLSGACYPVQPLPVISDQFAHDDDHNYIQLIRVLKGSHLAALTGRRWRMAPLFKASALISKAPGMLVIDRFLRVVLNKAESYRRRSFEDEIEGLQRFYGSSWWALSKPCLEYVRDFAATHPKFVCAFKSVYAPDEQLIHTIIGNSSFVGKTDGFQPDEGADSLYGAPLHCVSRSMTREFRDLSEDISCVLSSERLFARKFSSERHEHLLNMIDAKRHAREGIDLL